MSNSTLPIREKEEDFKELITNNQVVVVAGETGSGKTTQLPQICFEMGFTQKGKICVTQPRRIAATSTAKRVAEEMGVSVGQKVGYKVRFAEKQNEDTEILFMTDGMLLTELSFDKSLSKYSTLIIDEAHERSVNIDFILGYLRKLLKKRKDLKLIISSATIDTELFSKAFDNAPILEVSGRMFPVEVLYSPIEENGVSYIDKTIEEVEHIIAADLKGDILIFMPTERDILETVDRLSGRKFDNTLALPLFARLTRAQQNRIFSSCRERKIVVATNIAETSLTVPGIRFVIDTGLARIAKFAPNLRTNRLPIEDISQAEANQRKGRCGRVSEGICIRLYSEKDFLTRPEFRVAEIKRLNLASVILTLLNLRLGDIEQFPFLEAPEKRAISDAFSQLYELGATNSHRKLTKLGREMARLPLEPHISRMILQARQEGVVNEIAIIAAGLSIVDPRERPQDAAEAADEMHKKFIDMRSDFLTLLRLWESYNKTLLNLKTQSKMRKFCKEHFLSFNRMREWGDVHKQIVRTLRERKIKGNTSFGDSKENIKVSAIHRAILSGLVSSIAKYNKEIGAYKATRNRTVTLFPGSVLAKKKKRHDWIMAQEIIETSRTFARTVAPIDPRWVEDFIPHLLKKNYGIPYFDAEKGSVLIEEKLLFSGLTIVEGRKRFYGKIDIKKAREIFIQSALIEGNVNQKIPFLEHNLNLYEEVLEEEAKLRTNEFVVTDKELFEWYDKRLPNVASVRDLLGWIRKSKQGNTLFMKKEDLLFSTLPDDTKNFPKSLHIGDNSFPLSYVFEPGKENDGVTVTVPLSEVAFIRSETFEWIVPALWEEKIVYLLKSLPKSTRKKFAPIKENAKRLANAMNFEDKKFTEVLSDVILKEFGITIDPHEFSEENLPDHLKMRVAVVDEKGSIIKETRELDAVKSVNSEVTNKSKSSIKKSLQSQVIKNITNWNFGDLPKQKAISTNKDGITLYGYPALVYKNGTIELHYLSDPHIALNKHRVGVSHLLRMVLKVDLDWTKKDLKFNKKLKMYSSPFGGEAIVKEKVYTIIEEYICRAVENPPTTKANFDTLVEHRKAELIGIAHKSLTILEDTFVYEQQNRDKIKKFLGKNSSKVFVNISSELTADISSYIEQLIEGICPYQLFVNFSRYQKAYGYKIEKAFLNTSQYRKQETIFMPYLDKSFDFLEMYENSSIFKKDTIIEYILMVEEFSILLFAHPNMKPNISVSEKKLENMIEYIEAIKE